jgi:NAD-dependent SIR2 family protein deacetylase
VTATTGPTGAAHGGPAALDDERRLADLLVAGSVTVLSGAGISTESGIPAYRGADGVRRITPMSFDEFTATPAMRRRYWARGFVGWDRFRSARPNAGHHAVARLQALGVVGAVVTQNVDGLHQAAGRSAGLGETADVTELHGSLTRVVCLRCGTTDDRTCVQQRMAAANPLLQQAVDRLAVQVRPDGDVDLPDGLEAGVVVPCCLVCGSDLLKPDVVFFGEQVPRERVAVAFAAVDASRTLLVLGSSLQVMSGYRFVRHAHRRGMAVAVVNLGTTRGAAETTLHLSTALGPLLTRVVEDVAGRLASG